MASYYRSAIHLHIAKKFCGCCGEQFKSDSRSVYECRSCMEIKDKIIKDLFDEKQLYPNSKLTIKYSVNEVDHDGCCSDPGDEKIVHRQIKKIYSLPRWFKKHHISGKNIKNDCEILKYYQINPKLHGNGYCGMETKYMLISASIRQRVKDKSNPNVNLDE